MPFITNYSNGGDGIIAKSNIQTVEDLVGTKIGVPQFSEAHTLVAWFVNQSDLSQTDKDNILNNLIFFATPDEAAKAFFAGEVDVAATWEPYLTQAQNMTDCHIFFSTASSSSLVMDGILFNKAFADANSDVVHKFVQGALMASDLYKTDMPLGKLYRGGIDGVCRAVGSIHLRPSLSRQGDRSIGRSWSSCSHKQRGGICRDW